MIPPRPSLTRQTGGAQKVGVNAGAKLWATEGGVNSGFQRRGASLGFPGFHSVPFVISESHTVCNLAQQKRTVFIANVI